MKKCDLCGNTHDGPPPQVREAMAALVRTVDDDTHGDETKTAERILEFAAGLYSGTTGKSASRYIDHADLPSERRVRDRGSTR